MLDTLPRQSLLQRYVLPYLHHHLLILFNKALWSLANDQKAQARLREEVTPFMEGNMHPDYGVLKGLQWLDCVLWINFYFVTETIWPSNGCVEWKPYVFSQLFQWTDLLRIRRIMLVTYLFRKELLSTFLCAPYVDCEIPGDSLHTISDCTCQYVQGDLGRRRRGVSSRRYHLTDANLIGADGSQNVGSPCRKISILHTLSWAFLQVLMVASARRWRWWSLNLCFRTWIINTFMVGIDGLGPNQSFNHQLHIRTSLRWSSSSTK